MEYSTYQYSAEDSSCEVAGRQSIVPAASGNAAETSQVSLPAFVIMDDAALWAKPVMNFKGIVSGLIISAIFWILKILLLIKIFVS